jgi:putative membrane protein
VASGLVARDDGPGGTSPEEHARRILSERFANGDIDSEEFMQRASLLNWTPGVTEAAQRSDRR